MKNSLENSTQLIAKYLSFAKFEKGLSANTLLAYENDLVSFFEYINNENIEFIEEIKRKDISNFIRYIAKNNLQPSTITRKIASIKGFFKFLAVKEKVISDNPAKDIDAPTVKKALPRHLTLEESRLLLQTAKEQGGANTNDSI